ncbi:MAG: nucleotide exchange factor GrpE [Gammaproteobacteria bacterium]|nr:nucleotide exchange factor GrpE [Gammaproteobacteria bacterium]
MSSHDKNASKGNSTAALHQKLNPEGIESEPMQDEQEAELLDHPSYPELQKRLTESEEKATQYWERLLRMQAETDNAARRAERDIANAHKYALEKFVLDLLPIIDSMERSLQISADDASAKAVLEGIELTLKMFYTTLEKFGVEQVSPEGQAFNPELHQAVSVLEDAKVKPNTVISVLQKGYLLNNRLIRPALVIVAKASS